MSPVATPLVLAALGLVLPTVPHAAGRHAACLLDPRPRVTIMCASADGAADDPIAAAGSRVVEAARQFGGAQAEVAAEWVAETADGEAADDLLTRQLALFETCVIDGDDDDGAKCRELDAALGALESALKAGERGAPAERFAALFGSSRVDRATMRLTNAAARFGDEQGMVAAAWVSGVRADGKLNPAGLLEQQHQLFGECLLDEDGTGSARCLALQDALAAFQRSLGVRGNVVSTRDLRGAEAEAPAE
jgi:hypothetical protein